MTNLIYWRDWDNATPVFCGDKFAENIDRFNDESNPEKGSNVMPSNFYIGLEMEIQIEFRQNDESNFLDLCMRNWYFFVSWNGVEKLAFHHPGHDLDFLSHLLWLDPTGRLTKAFDKLGKNWDFIINPQPYSEDGLDDIPF